MKDLESKLKKLPLIAPSRDLDGRVLAQEPERPVQPFRRARRFPLWATGAIALTTGLLGFALGVARRAERPVAPWGSRAPVVIQVIYDSPSSRNPFDFTRASHFFPARKVETTTGKVQTTI